MTDSNDEAKQNSKPKKRRGPGNRKPNAGDRAAELERAARRERVNELTREGKNYREIAVILGVSVSTAYEDFQKLITHLPTDGVAEDRRKHTARLDAAYRRTEQLVEAISAVAHSGNLAAIREVARLIDRQVSILARAARVNGVDAPEQREHTGPGGGPLQLAQASVNLAELLALGQENEGNAAQPYAEDGGGAEGRPGEDAEKLP